MCGLFATTAPTPDPATLHALATEAARRGPHGWGIAVLHGDRFTRTTGPGPLPRDQLPDHGPLIGQARLASNGEWRDDRQQQPLLASNPAVALVHNGYLPGVPDHGTVDTAALIPAAQEGAAALIHALATLGAGQPQAVLVLTATALIALPAGHPLWLVQRPEGAYVGSRFIAGAVPLPALRILPF